MKRSPPPPKLKEHHFLLKSLRLALDEMTFYLCSELIGLGS